MWEKDPPQGAVGPRLPWIGATDTGERQMVRCLSGCRVKREVSHTWRGSGLGLGCQNMPVYGEQMVDRTTMILGLRRKETEGWDLEDRDWDGG